MKADWKMYELIIFNIIQNSVKYYEKIDANIMIVLTCKPRKRENNAETKENCQNYVLETLIIDTGSGIEKER